MGNRSLDDFLDAGSDDQGDAGDTDGPGDGAGTDAPASEHADGADTGGGEDATVDTEGEGDTGTPEPTLSAYAWDPDGGECADCGVSVERRWRQDGGLVCPDCKEW